MKEEIFVLTIGNDDDMDVAVFNDSDVAVKHFKELVKGGFPVSVHRVEVNSYKPILRYQKAMSL